MWKETNLNQTPGAYIKAEIKVKRKQKKDDTSITSKYQDAETKQFSAVANAEESYAGKLPS